MPYTKRIAIHGASGLKKALKYITNEEKTLQLSSGYGCSVLYGYEEMMKVQQEHHHPAGMENRTGYHIIQSFFEDDPVSPQQVHEMGLELVRTLYPDYQAVVSTHQDRFHLHNHIVLNSVNRKTGRKLEDKLKNKTEGLYGLRKASDEIAKRYGCKADPSAPIGRYRRKNYSGELFEEREESQTFRIIQRIKQGMDECTDCTELYKQMIQEGYRFNRNQKDELTIRKEGWKRAVNEKNFPEAYRQKELESFFQKKRSTASLEFLEDVPEGKTQLAREIESQCVQIGADLLIVNDYIHTQKMEEEAESMSGFVQSRYQEIQRHNFLARVVDCCNQNGLETRQDVCVRVMENNLEIQQLETKYRKKKKTLKDLEAKEDGSPAAMARLRKELNRLYAQIRYAKSQQSVLDELELRTRQETSFLKQILFEPEQIIARRGKQFLIQLSKNIRILIDEALTVWDHLKGIYKAFFLNERPEVVYYQNKRMKLTYDEMLHLANEAKEKEEKESELPSEKKNDRSFIQKDELPAQRRKRPVKSIINPGRSTAGNSNQLSIERMGLNER
jgi:hypothetical protein